MNGDRAGGLYYDIRILLPPHHLEEDTKKIKKETLPMAIHRDPPHL
jgi:hypothetical protein